MLDTEHIKTLIIREIAGELTTQEEALLRETLNSHPELEALRGELREKLLSDEAQRGLEDMRQNFNFSKVKRKIYFLRISSAAAAILVVIAGIFWWQSARFENQAKIAPGSGRYVKLVLSSGEEVDLSGAGQKQVGAITLTSSSQKLTYSNGTGGASAMATLHVPDGKDYSVRLSDGTEIQLNSGSTLSFPFTFSDSIREVTISGEAFLTVAKEAAKPFLVRLSPSVSPGTKLPMVQVLGTQFNVNTYNAERISVALVEGSVKMSVGNSSLRLKPGQQAFAQRGKEMTAQAFDPDVVLGWRSGMLEFKGARLQEVFEALPRWYGVKVAVEDPSLNGKLFTGVLDRSKPVSSFLKDLAYTHNTRFQIVNGTIHIRSADK